MDEQLCHLLASKDTMTVKLFVLNNLKLKASPAEAIWIKVLSQHCPALVVYRSTCL